MSAGSEGLPSPWNRRPLGMVARSAAVLIVIFAVAGAVWLGRVIFFAAFFSWLVAAFLSVPVKLLERIKVPRVVATIISTLVLLGVFAGLFALAWPTLSDQLVVIRTQLPEALSGATEWVQRQARAVAGGGGEADVMGDLRDTLTEQLGTLIAGVLPVLNSLVGAVTGVVLAFFAGVYLTMEAPLVASQAVRIVPPAARDRAAGAMEEAGGTLKRWMVGTFISMIAVGLLVGIVLWILGIPAALALGIIAGIFEFVPIIGPILAAVPAIALALIVSPERAFWVLLALIAVQQVESNLLTPIVMRGVVRLPPALTILFQALMALLFGFLGLFLAVPILAVLVVLVRRLYVEPMEERVDHPP